MKHCMENHRNDPNRVVSAAGTGWLCVGRLLAVQMQHVSGWFGLVWFKSLRWDLPQSVTWVVLDFPSSSPLGGICSSGTILEELTRACDLSAG